MASLYRCAACGSPNVQTDIQVGEMKYNYLKGAIGTAVIGAGGAVAGIENKKTHVFKCPDCGTTLSYPMDAETCFIIDMCVASLTYRNNLNINGVSIPWSFYTDKYKNIEKGYADMKLSERRDKYNALLKSKATASRDEFNQAFLDLREYRAALSNWLRFNKAVSKEIYIKGAKALKVFLENLYIYIPPTAFNEINHAKYKDELILLSKIWGDLGDYLLFWHLETFGYPMMNAENWYELAIQQNDFAKAFIFVYSQNRHFVGSSWIYREDDSICYGWNSGNRMAEKISSFPIGAFWNKCTAGTNVINQKIFTPIAYPRFVYNKLKMCPFSWVTDSDGNKRETSIQVYMDRYFTDNPEKKNEFDVLIQKRDMELLEIEKAKENIAKFDSEKAEYLAQQKCLIETNKTKIQAMKLEISKQTRKILGKSKARVTIERLEKEIQQLKEQNDHYLTLIQRKEEEKSDNIPIIQDKNAFSLNLCSRMEFFYPQMFETVKSTKR